MTIRRCMECGHDRTGGTLCCECGSPNAFHLRRPVKEWKAEISRRAAFDEALS